VLIQIVAALIALSARPGPAVAEPGIVVEPSTMP
jgi:hypothetical protein